MLNKLRFRLQTQVGMSFALVIIIFIISGSFSIRLLLKMESLSEELLKINYIEILMLEARRHEKNFLLRKDNISIGKVHEQIRLLRTTVKMMNNDDADTRFKVFFDSISEQIQLYEFSFDNIVSEITANRSYLDGTMTQAMVDIAREVLDTCNRLQNMQQLLIKQMLQGAIAILILNIVFAVFVSFVLALLVFRGMILPIRKCAAFAQEIARGDFNQKLDIVSVGSMDLLSRSMENMLEQLKQRIGFVEGVLKGLPVPCAVIDTQEKISFINRCLLDYLEADGDIEDYIGVSWAEFVYNDSTKDTLIFKAIQQGRAEKYDLYSLYSRKGNLRHTRLDIALLEDLDKNPLGGFVVITDLTHIKDEQDKLCKVHLSLKSKSQELELVLHTIENQVWYIADNTCLFANNARSSFLGRSCEEIKSKKVNEIISGKEADQFSHYTSLVMASKQKQHFEIWSRNHSRERRLLFVTKVPKLDHHGNVEFIVTVARDITEQRHIEDQLRYKSYHDQLTGLYNRHFLIEEMQRLQKGRFFPLGVVFCDLDDLKLTNDSLGHECGDRLIIKVAELMRDSFRASDIIARYGGDEFVIILPRSNASDMENAMRRFHDNVVIFNKDYKEFVINISVGFAVSHDQSDSIQDLLVSADTRMYQAKKQKKAAV